jgi:hypothetical protein
LLINAGVRIFSALNGSSREIIGRGAASLVCVNAARSCFSSNSDFTKHPPRLNQSFSSLFYDVDQY